jgi:two-component sensor histidine kinase
MYRYSILLLINLFSVTTVIAQTAVEAKVIRENIASSKIDTSRVNLLLKYGRYYLNKPGEFKNDLDSALLLSAEARKLSYSLYDDPGVGRSILLDGQIYREDGRHDLAWKTNEKALAFFIAHKMPYETGEAYRAAAAFFDIAGDDLDKKITYTEKAILLMQQRGNSIELAFALQDLGDYYQLKDEWTKSIKVLQRALDVYNTVGYQQIQGVTNLLGFVYHRNGQDTLALKYGLLAVRVAESVHDNSLQLCTIYNRLAITYYDLKKNELSLYYYQKAEAIAEKYKDAGSIQQIKFNLAVLLRRLNRPEKSLIELKELVKQYPPTEKDLVITTAYLFANIYMDLKQFPQAKYYIDSLGKLRKKYPKEISYAMYFNKGPIRYYFETRQFEKAYKYLNSNDSLVRLNHSPAAHMENEMYWSRIDSAVGNFPSALAHYKLYKLVSDSNKSEILRKQLNELQLQFDVEHKDQHIAMLTQQSQLQENRIRIESIYRRIFIGGLAVLFIFLALVYNRYLIKKRSNLIMERKQGEINNQNELLKNLVSEKEWLLKEIHHRVKNNLQIVISLLNTQSAFLENEDALSAIKNSQHRMHAMSLIHQRLYQTDNLGAIDVVSYIRELIDYLKQSFGSNQQIDYLLDLTPMKLDVAEAVPLGLILNEAICNAIKYAFRPGKKGEISVILKEIYQGRYLLKITDNGIGLPEDFDIMATKSLGMSLMQGLTDQLEGIFTIEYENGLSISVEFSHNRTLKFNNLTA